jgi:hypothetical protein
MKYVKCLYNGGSSNRLTIGKIYEVFATFPINSTELIMELIEVKDNLGDLSTYYLKDDDGTWFEDATKYIREDKLNELGI